MTQVLENYHSKSVFEEVFATRGSESDGNSEGVFDQVFVRRGRWRKSPSTSTAQDADKPDNVLRLAEHVVSTIPHVDYPVPSLEDMTTPKLANLVDNISPGIDAPSGKMAQLPEDKSCSNLEIVDNAPFVVKNTFIDTSGLDYDSLREFFQERKVQSWPASLDKTIDFEAIIGNGVGAEAAARLQDGLLNTASTFGDIETPRPAATQELIENGNGITTIHLEACVDTERSCNEPVFRTSSTFADGELEGVQQRISEVACSKLEPIAWDVECYFDQQANQEAFLNPVTTSLPGRSDVTASSDQLTAAEERLRSLRSRGSEIQRRIYENVPDNTMDEARLEMEVRQALGMDSSFIQQIPVPWQETACMQDSILTNGGNLQLHELVPASSEPPALDVSMMAMLPIPPPPLEMAPVPVLRLAESLPPPELGSPGLPSVGSMSHHNGECRPCAFFHTSGCENKEQCTFCHLCGPSEKKKRLRIHRAQKRESKLAALTNAKENIDSSEDGAYASHEGHAETDETVDVDCIVE
jgi:hypothetical protein